ncbi:hypothetical protein LTR84_005918 [Exophiala bonariae]|uniref:Peptidase M43 pregnancy-associated plasma-A domain-containing protein n=1 Tax=Exophiala bonariae TaxID=1690606 RepID=A0AAV9N2B4_9EURO|nr:hypothetical protein LTR84_005918 [Exophiala bonariae]
MATLASQKSMVQGPNRSLGLCGTDQLNGELLATDPGYRARRQAVESFSRLAINAPSSRTGTAHIAVVVHVIYNTEEEKIQKPQIDEQIRVLNEDYSAQNTDQTQLPDVFKPLVGNPNIRFFLATRDPQGNPTTGIVYKQTTAQSFPMGANGSINRKMKSEPLGSKGWRADRYLNLWVCDLGDSLLGYASFPATESLTQDGVVINYRYFGVGGTATKPFHLGRTASHEVGHWLNLRHIWGDDQDPSVSPMLWCSESDLVDDTPNQAGPNSGEPKFPKISCGNGPDGDLFYNYMDYSDDKICVMFTKGQVDRINATLAVSRKSLLGSDFSNRRISRTTALGEVKDNSVHFLVHDGQKDGGKELVAISKKDLTIQILSTEESQSETKATQKTNIGFKADGKNPDADLLFSFGKDSTGVKPDLYVLQSSPTHTSLSVVSGSSSYQESSTVNASVKLRTPGPVYSFAIAPWTKDSKGDLVVLQKPNNRKDTYSVHLSVLSGSSGFSETVYEYTTHILDNSLSSLDLQLADWNGDGSLDLVVIKKSKTSKNLTEVTVLSGASDFKDVIYKTSTMLGGTERNFTFLCADWTGDGGIDLVGIKKWDTGSGHVEVHVLAG